MVPRILTPISSMAVGASYLMYKERLQRDLDRLDRFRNLTSNFAESLSDAGRERARHMEESLIESLIESSAAFVRATSAVRQLIGET